MKSRLGKVVFGEALEALKRIRESPRKLALAYLCDFLFLAAYGFAAYPLFGKIVDYVIAIGTIVSEKSPQVIRGANQGLASIIRSDPQASQMLNSLMLVFLLLAVAIYITFVLFQGISWKLSSEIAGRNIHFHKYMKRFALLALFWIVLFSAYHLISLFSDIRAAVLKIAGEGAGSFHVFVTALLIALLYFAFVSFTLAGTSKGGIKNSFRTGAKKAGYIVSAYLVMAVAALALHALLMAAAKVDFNLMIAVGLLTVIPAITWARVYFTLVVQKAR